MRFAAFRPGCGEPVRNDTGYEKIKEQAALASSVVACAG